MSVGLGIVLAALIIVVAWQVDKRGAWRKFAKASLWLLGAVVLLSALFAGWLYWDDQAGPGSQRAEVKKIRAGEIESYWGIRLGATGDEVEYVKGQPDKKYDDGEQGERWIYWAPSESADPSGEGRIGYVLYLSRDKKVQNIACAPSSMNYCDRIAHIGNNSTEKEILDGFGQPQFGPTISDGKKWIAYGTRTRNVSFILAQDRVTLIAVMTRLPKTLSPDRANQ